MDTNLVEHAERIPMSWEEYEALDEDVRGEYITVYCLVGDDYEKRGIHAPGKRATLDVGPAKIKLDPAELVR